MSECTGTCSTCSPIVELDNSIKALAEISEIDYDRLPLPTAAVMNVTDECNNKCPYCFVHFQKNYMTFETADKAAQFLLKNCEKNGKNQKPSLAFFGGEPLLCFYNVIKPLVEKYKGQFKWSVTTNGTLLTEEIIDFLSDNKFGILLSWDGVKEVQDEQRPSKDGESSFDKIMANIHYLLLKCPDTVCRGTITKKSIPYLFDSFMLFIQVGAKNCAFCINEDEEYAEEDFEELKAQLNKIGLYIHKKLLKGERPIYFSPLVSIFKTIQDGDFNPTFNNNVNRCGMGTVAIGIAYDGTLNPCQEENSTNKFAIGNLDSGIDKEAHLKYLNLYLESMKNMHCQGFCSSSMRYTCFNSQCPNSIIQNNGEISLGKCLYNKAMYLVAARLYRNHKFSIFPNISQYFGG